MFVFKRLVFLTFVHVLFGQQWTNRNNQGADRWFRDYGFYRGRSNPNVCSFQTCRLPNCFCAGKEAPKKMDPTVLPQIVMFTFDDAVNEQVFDYYKELFPEDLVNPNGCPVSVTFFVSHNWTDYDMVKQLHARGHEIASHSITHRMPQSWWRYGPAEDWEMEIQGQRENLAEKSSIPIEDIKGMRAPFLDTGGDEQFKMLRKYGFEYDASFMTGPHDKGGVWPFTLNFVPSWEYCTNLNCPKEKHPGIWEVPLNRWVGIDGNACSMVDACQQQPRHKGETLAYLWQNFNKHYYGNRSPVGVNMHATWFKTEHHYEAMKEFVQTISDMDDVYIITVHQTLQWIRNPRTIDRVANFQPWLRTCKGSVASDGRMNIRNAIQHQNVEAIEPKELPGPDNFDNSVYFMEREDEPTGNDYDFIVGQSEVEDSRPRYVQIERTNMILPDSIGDEFIQDYRFTENRMPQSMQRIPGNNAIYMAGKLRPVSGRNLAGDHSRANENPFQVKNVVSESEFDKNPGENILIGDTRGFETDSSIAEAKISSISNTAKQIPESLSIDGVQSTNISNKVFEEEVKEFESFNKIKNPGNGQGSIHDVVLKEAVEFKNIKLAVENEKGSELEASKVTNDITTTAISAKPSTTVKQSSRVPPSPPRGFRPRGRPTRPRLGGIAGRSDLQSRQRNRSAVSSGSSNKFHIETVVISGTIAILIYNQVSWL